MRTVKASEFKAKCLGLIDEVAATGKPVVVTKRGKRVARLVPEPPPRRRKSIFGFMRGEIKIRGDIISPLNEPWSVDTE